MCLIVCKQSCRVSPVSHVRISQKVKGALMMAGWRLLTFFICLHKQLSSFIHSIHVLRVRMFEKCYSANRQ